MYNTCSTCTSPCTFNVKKNIIYANWEVLDRTGVLGVKGGWGVRMEVG